MKTPTLIVRLIGIYLLTVSVIGLIQVGRLKTFQQTMQQSIIKQQTTPGVPIAKMPENPLLDDMNIYAWIGLVVGLGAAATAGPLARVLTFDSEPPNKNPSLRDQLL